MGNQRAGNKLLRGLLAHSLLLKLTERGTCVFSYSFTCRVYPSYPPQFPRPKAGSVPLTLGKELSLLSKFPHEQDNDRNDARCPYHRVVGFKARGTYKSLGAAPDAQRSQNRWRCCSQHHAYVVTEAVFLHTLSSTYHSADRVNKCRYF